MQSTVLVVDDESDVVDLIRYKLRAAGFAVLEANDGLAALRTARDARPDLVVLDLMLPEMTGEEVCRQLKSNADTAAIPVLMLTAKGQPSERIAGLEIGADDYLIKPFSPRELVLRVEAVLRRVRGGGKARRAGEDRRFYHRPGYLRDHPGKPQTGTDHDRVQAALFAARTPGPRAIPRIAAHGGLGLHRHGGHPHGGHPHPALARKTRHPRRTHRNVARRRLSIHHLGDRHRLNASPWLLLLAVTGLSAATVAWMVFAYVRPALRLQDTLKRLAAGDWGTPAFVDRPGALRRAVQDAVALGEHLRRHAPAAR